MDAEHLFIDTNILIYASAAESPQHNLALESLRQWRAKGTQQWISPQVLREYVAVTTRPKTFTSPISRKAVLNRAHYFQEHFYIAYESPRVVEKFLMLVQNVDVGGKQIHDANIVATMLAHNITHLLTHNVADFARFDIFITVVPLDKPICPPLPLNLNPNRI